MNPSLRSAPLILLVCLATVLVVADVPQIINYQGRVAVGTVNFNGSGQFKFALVNATGTTTYWSNDGSSTAGSEPAAAVLLTVTKGLYSVLLGDATLANMTAIPNSVFDNGDVRLRVWFNDGTLGSQLLTPDQRIAAVGYAITAASAQTVPDGAITSDMIADDAVGSLQIQNGSVTASKIGGMLAVSQIPALDASKITSGVLNSGRIPVLDDSKLGTGSVSSSQILNGTVLIEDISSAAATSGNTANTLVLRDASGNFFAGAITAQSGLLVGGNASITGSLQVQTGATIVPSLDVFGPVGFNNNLTVGGNLNVVGSLTASSKSFKIDHPQDPANKYLYHYCVESSEQMNIYSGAVRTDASGMALVALPSYFESLNKQFTYQLTVVGKSFAQVRVEEEIQAGKFSIRSSLPNIKICWQVTGVRADPAAQIYARNLEEEKAPAERGRYLHPEAYGQPAERGIGGSLQTASPSPSTRK